MPQIRISDFCENTVIHSIKLDMLFELGNEKVSDGILDEDKSLQALSDILIYAELSGDFPWEILGSQFIKVFGHLIWCLKTQTLLNSSMIIK